MNILITGASSGIGHSLAKKFAAVAENRVIVLSRNLNKLQELASGGGGRIVPVEFDITKYDYNLLMATLEKEGIRHIDILIHNAGLLVNKPFRELEIGDWEQTYKTNVIGVALLTKTLLGKIGGDDHTHIVTIGSIGGVNGTTKFGGLSAYSSSKGALTTLTECLAEEFRGQNVTSNCLALGAVQTEMLAKAFPGYVAKLTSEEISDYIYDFSVKGWMYFSGKILQVSVTNP